MRRTENVLRLQLMIEIREDRIELQTLWGNLTIDPFLKQTQVGGCRASPI